MKNQIEINLPYLKFPKIFFFIGTAIQEKELREWVTASSWTVALRPWDGTGPPFRKHLLWTWSLLASIRPARVPTSSRPCPPRWVTFTFDKIQYQFVRNFAAIIHLELAFLSIGLHLPKSLQRCFRSVVWPSTRILERNEGRIERHGSN